MVKPGNITRVHGIMAAMCFLWAVILSAALVESDAYRYAMLLLVALGSAAYRRELAFVRVNWLAWLCMGWGLYAFTRFVWLLAMTPLHDKGSSEWLYVFPVFFPILGVALYQVRHRLAETISIFFIMTLMCLLVTTQYRTIITGVNVTPLLHKNQIHGAVACGFLTIGAFYWLMYWISRGINASWMGKVACAISPLIQILCLFNIFGSKSKGVWLAMALAIPLMAISAMTHIRVSRRVGVALAGGFVAVMVIGVSVARDNMWHTAGPTAVSAIHIVEDIATGEAVSQRLTEAIRSPDVPFSMNARLQIWSNAWELFSAAPWIGHGNSWIRLWDQTQYASVGFTLMHNAYLEILVRHGLFGIVVFGVILVGFLNQVRGCYRRGLISRSAWTCYWISILYFLITIGSNSNNRLAIGEAFFVLTGAFAFFCAIKMQTAQRPSQKAKQTLTN